MNDYFLECILELRSKELIQLKVNEFDITTDEEELVVEYLRTEYKREALDYPHQAPEFDAEAALWGAKLFYYAVQLLLYREKSWEEASALFDKKLEAINASQILSADLCLRFIPQVCTELYILDQEDPLLAYLKTVLNEWHYSGIQGELEVENLKLDVVKSSPCLLSLYCDRLIENKNLALGLHSSLKNEIINILGAYPDEYWKAYIEKINENEN